MSNRQRRNRRDQQEASTGLGTDSSEDLAQDDSDNDSDLLSESKFRRMKWIVSALLMFHLLAVLMPPLAFQTSGPEGPSPLFGLIIRPFLGYGQFFHMDRGYAFFAPDPGPSHLIQAAAVGADGEMTERMFPDRNDQWPRLLYHRHFMLTEYLNEIYEFPGPPQEIVDEDPFNAAIWQQRRGRYEHVRQSMVDHLKSENQGREVAIRRLRHGMPSLQDFVAEPIALDDPRLYEVVLDQPIFSDPLDPANSEEIPVPSSGPDSDAQPLPASREGVEEIEDDEPETQTEATR